MRLALLIGLLLAACGSAAKRPTQIKEPVGVCGELATSGVVSKTPTFERIDRDLNGDGENEWVVADKTLCQGENCYWNIFSGGEIGGCHRYLGTISGAFIDRLTSSHEAGYRDLRAWWRFSSPERHLLQEYRFTQGGYRLVEAMACSQVDSRLVCAREPASVGE